MTGLLTFSATIGEFFIEPLLVGLVKPNLKKIILNTLQLILRT